MRFLAAARRGGRMNISLRWLEAFLRRPLDPRDVASRLGMLGAPVDAIEPLHADLGDLVVGLVEEVASIPTPTGCGCASSTTGPTRGATWCAARPTCTAGRKYPFAPVGASVPHGKGGAPMRIEKAKLRGELSEGMLCSARELGLGQEHDGILELDTDAAPGTPLLEAVPARRSPARWWTSPRTGPTCSATRAWPGSSPRRTACRSGCRRSPAPRRWTSRRPAGRRPAGNGRRRHDHDRGHRVVPPIPRRAHPRRAGRAVARVAAPAARGGRRALDQQRGGRDQLRDARAEPADARLRRAPAARRRAHRAPRPRPGERLVTLDGVERALDRGDDRHRRSPTASSASPASWAGPAPR